MSEEDDDQGECEKCLVVLDFDVASGVHATEVVQPGVASLDDPAVTCETIARPLDHSICALPTDFRGARQDRLTSRSTPADDRLDTPLEQTFTLRRSVVPTISPELSCQDQLSLQNFLLQLFAIEACWRGVRCCQIMQDPSTVWNKILEPS